MNTYAYCCPDRLNALVIDGVTVRSACCAISEDEHGVSCKIPLTRPHDKFCPSHAYKENLCYRKECNRPIVEGTWACEDQVHQNLAKETFEERQKKAADELIKRIERESVAFHLRAGQSERPVGTQPGDHCRPGISGDLEQEEEESLDAGYDPVDDEDGPADETQAKRKARLRKMYWRRRFTNNEQLAVRPCGMIIGRTSMYDAEGIVSVKVRFSMFVPKITINTLARCG